MFVFLLEILLLILTQIEINCGFITRKSFKTSTVKIQNEDMGIILDTHEMSLGDAYRFDTFLHNIIKKRSKGTSKVNLNNKISRDASSQDENNVSQLELINRLKSNR
jgi:hypothetical protein